MSNSYFQFKHFTIHQDQCAMKVCTDACLFGAWLRDKMMKENNSVGDALDIGSGTGLLSMMLAQQEAIARHIDALEIDEAAAKQSLENISKAGMNDKIAVYATALQKFNPGKKYQLIISNPPFFFNDLKGPDKRRSAAMHESDLFLDDIIEFASQYLSDEGKLALLMPFHRKEEMMNSVMNHNLYPQYVCDVRQTSSHEKFRVMTIVSKKFSEILHEEIVIKIAERQYSEAFVRLLKEFYLYL